MWLLACLFPKSLQSYLTLCNPMSLSPPDSSVHGILQARILEWDAMPSSRGIFPTQGSNPCLLCLLHWQAGSLPLSPPGKPTHTIRTHSRGWTEKHKWNNSCYQGPQPWPCRVQTPCTCFCFYQQVSFCWVFARHLLLCSVFYKYYPFNLHNPVRYVPSSPLSKEEFQDSGHWVTCPESHTVSSQVEKQTQAS